MSIRAAKKLLWYLKVFNWNVIRRVLVSAAAHTLLAFSSIDVANKILVNGHDVSIIADVSSESSSS